MMKFNCALQEAFDGQIAAGGGSTIQEPTQTTQTTKVDQPNNVNAQPNNVNVQPNNINAQPNNINAQQTTPSLLGDDSLDKQQSQEQQVNPDIPDTADGYEFNAGEGKTVSDVDKANYSTISKELGLTKEQAQKLYEFGSKKILETQLDNIKKAGQLWFNEVQQDPELGGVHFSETKSNLARVMNKYATPEVRELFNQTQLGSHPALVRMFNAIGRDLGEDNNFINGEQVKQKIDPLKSLYNNSPNLV